MCQLLAIILTLCHAPGSLVFAAEKTKDPAGTMHVPIRQLIGELKAKSKRVPNDGETHFYLGRLYALVWAQGANKVLVSKLNGLPFHEKTAPLLPKITKKATSPKYLQGAFYHFSHARAGGYDTPAATLGMTWCTEQTGKQRSFVIKNYRTLLQTALKPEPNGKVPREHKAVAAEVRERLLVLLDPKENAAELAELRKAKY